MALLTIMSVEVPFPGLAQDAWEHGVVATHPGNLAQNKIAVLVWPAAVGGFPSVFMERIDDNLEPQREPIRRIVDVRDGGEIGHGY